MRYVSAHRPCPFRQRPVYQLARRAHQGSPARCLPADTWYTLKGLFFPSSESLARHGPNGVQGPPADPFDAAKQPVLAPRSQFVDALPARNHASVDPRPVRLELAHPLRLPGWALPQALWTTPQPPSPAAPAPTVLSPPRQQRRSKLAAAAQGPRLRPSCPVDVVREAPAHPLVLFRDLFPVPGPAREQNCSSWAA